MARRRNGLTIVKDSPSPFTNDYRVGYDRWIFGRFYPAGPVALNLVSEGRVALGEPVPTPEVLKNRPLKPPGQAA